MNNYTRILLATAALFGASTGFSAIVFSDFSTFTNGNLVGQNSWALFNASGSAPIQVTGGKVTWAGLSPGVVDNQDAFLPFASIIPVPASGTTTVYLALQLSVASAGVSTSYFAALNPTSATGARFWLFSSSKPA